MNKSNERKHKTLQTHEPELLNPAHHNHALNKVMDSCKPSSFWQGLEVEHDLYMRSFLKASSEEETEVNKEIFTD